MAFLRARRLSGARLRQQAADLLELLVVGDGQRLLHSACRRGARDRSRGPRRAREWHAYPFPGAPTTVPTAALPAGQPAIPRNCQPTRDILGDWSPDELALPDRRARTNSPTAGAVACRRRTPAASRSARATCREAGVTDPEVIADDHAVRRLERGATRRHIVLIATEAVCEQHPRSRGVTRARGARWLQSPAAPAVAEIRRR